MTAWWRFHALVNFGSCKLECLVLFFFSLLSFHFILCFLFAFSFLEKGVLEGS